MKKNTWTDDEINFLIENYSKCGMQYCVKHLKYNKEKISRMTCKLKLKINKEAKVKFKGINNSNCNINPELFYTISSKEISYFLGLFWADGSLYKGKGNHNIILKLTENDIISIKNTLNKIGKWNYYFRKNENIKQQNTISVFTNNKRIYDFLIENDYNEKSFYSANKILNKIPLHLHSYFFRGLVDGDGCFYYFNNEKNIIRQFSISSTYEQDWTYVEEILKKMNIKYSIKRSLNEKSSSSQIRITNKEGINKFGKFIYEGMDIDKIGLVRKYEKYKSLIN